MLWTSAKLLSCAVAITAALSSSNAANAEQLNAGALLKNMSAGERFTYLAGVVEGLAHVRADSAASACLFRWYYDEPANRRKIDAAFARYPDQYAAPIILALTRKHCGAT